MKRTVRPAEHLVHGLDGPVVVIDGGVCAILDRLLSLDKVGRQVRGQNEQLDHALVAIRLVGIAYTESFATETSLATEPKPATRSTQQLNNTVNTTTAATILGMTGAAVRKAIRENRLPATHLDGRYRITRDDLATYRATRNT